MKVHKKDIQSLNKNKTARKGKVYSDFEGTQYIGNKDGSLSVYQKSNKDKLSDSALEARVKANEDNITDLDLTKEDITDVDKKLADVECKLLAFNIVMG